MDNNVSEKEKDLMKQQMLNSSDERKMSAWCVKLLFCCGKQWSWQAMIMNAFPNRPDNCQKHESNRNTYLSQIHR